MSIDELSQKTIKRAKLVETFEIILSRSNTGFVP